MTTPATEQTREPIGLECPACDNDGTRAPLRFVASDVSSTEIVAFHRGDVLELAGPVAKSNVVLPQLGCDACHHRFELPTFIRGISWRLA